jgi:hypothetical protein
MARLHRDFFNMSKAAFGILPGQLRETVAALAVCAIAASNNSICNKVMRIIKRDPTNYIAWNDLPGQLDRLATERFDELKGALAPAAIYDRRNFVKEAIESTVNKLYVLKEKGIYVLGGAAMLLTAGYWLQDCGQNYASEQCWNHLGVAIKDPTFLAAIATAYTVTQVGAPVLNMGLGTFSFALLILSTAGDGLRGGPTVMRVKEELLQERYQDLANVLSQQWEKAKKSDDPTATKNIAKKAEQLNRRMLLVQFGLSENLNMTNEVSQNILSPLEQAANKIIIESKQLIKST